MNDNGKSNLEHLAAAVCKVVDREAKRRGMSAAEVCSALGAAAGASVGVNVPAAFDEMMLQCLAVGFATMVRPAREAKG